jgi:2-polyprenyl-6-methoxyphenol hydroxylase-like FAD-dependent oxidoreductase
MTTSAERVVISGCGIAGPVLGMFLRRMGKEAVVCDVRPREASSTEGAFLGVAPNGMNVLAALGVADAVEAVGAPCHAFEFQNARGETIATIDRRADATAFGARLHMVRRPDLHRVLTGAAIAAGVEVHFERRLVDLDRSDPRGITARFEDVAGKAHDERGSMLIGCDGLRSETRKLALSGSPEPAYTGLLDFGGYARCDTAPLEPGVNVMVFGRRAFFGAFRTPSGEIWWFHNSGEKETDGAGRDRESLRARALELHRDDPAWIRDVLTSSHELLGPYALHDILTMPRWHAGRVCLIGDAAHATTPSAGQGVSLALEDAMVLAKSLRDIPEPSAAFAAFERARRARVEDIVRQSRRVGSTKAVSGPVSEWLRDRMLPFFLRLGTSAQNRAYAHRIEWAEPMRAA